MDDLRYSYGVGITWITGFGPMSFAISKPTNAGQYEETKEFQFTVGNGLIKIKYHTPIRVIMKNLLKFNLFAALLLSIPACC